MEQGNNEPWHIMDEIAAVKTNMDYTGTYIQKRFEQQNDFITDHHQKVGEALKEHQQETGEHITNANALVIEAVTYSQDKVIDAVASAKDEVTSLVAGAVDTALELNVEIVSNDDTLKQVVLLTTFQGTPRDYTTVTIQAIGGGTSTTPDGSLTDVTPTHTQSLGTGTTLLTLPSTSKVFKVDVMIEPQYKQPKLISFGV